MTKSASLPWKSVFAKTFAIIRHPSPQFIGYFIIFFILALPAVSDFSDWQSYSPLQLWLFLSGFCVWMAIAYFVWVSFLLWAKPVFQGEKTKRPSLRVIFKTASALLVPLTILTLRGAILFLVGLIALVIPGFYFSFKYELASFHLILFGWEDEHPPIEKAEKIIKKYRFKLVPLALIMISEWMGSWILEAILGAAGVKSLYSVQLSVGLFSSCLEIFASLILTGMILEISE